MTQIPRSHDKAQDPTVMDRLLRNRRFWIITGALSFVGSLTVIYALYISPRFGYLGYTFDVPNPAVALSSVLLALAPSMFLPVAFGRPSHVVLWILYILAFVPSMIIPHFTLAEDPLVILTFSLSVFIAYCLLVTLSIALPLLDLPRLRIHRISFWIIVLSLAILFLGAIVAIFGINLDIPSLGDVYDTRGEYAEARAGAGRLAAYSVSWLGNVIAPFLIAIGLVSLNLPLIAIGFLVQLFIFASTGFKSVLFAGLLMLALAFALRRGGRHFGPSIIWGAVGVIALTLLLDVITGSIIFSSLFVRRLIITPGLIAGFFFEFFSTNPTAKLGHSVFAPFIGYPYESTPPFVVAQAYFGRSASANANLWADAFANFSYPGILVFTLILVIVLWLFDSLARNRNPRQGVIIALLLGIPSFSLSNSALLTSLLHHGIIFSFLLLFFMPKRATEKMRQLKKFHWFPKRTGSDP